MKRGIKTGMHFIPEKKKLFSYARGGQVLNLKGKDSNILIANCICSSEMALLFLLEDKSSFTSKREFMDQMGVNY